MTPKRLAKALGGVCLFGKIEQLWPSGRILIEVTMQIDNDLRGTRPTVKDWVVLGPVTQDACGYTNLTMERR